MIIDLIRRKSSAILFVCLLVLIYFPLFLHLDYMPIRMWDESILGTNAIEMGQNHHYIVTYFNGIPEMSNTKPPLVIWCILLFSKVLGFSELSLRLPSALAALVLCVFLFLVLRKYTGSAVFGFFTVCVLVTCRGYIRNHVTRTGEYDSMLVLFSTMASICLFLAVEAFQKRTQSKYLFLFFFMLTLALLTKGVACMMMMPGLFIYVLLRKKAVSFLSNRSFYIGLSFFLLFGVGYYFLRESLNPGYLKAVWENELGGRYNSTYEGHDGAFSFYLTEMINWQFADYYLLFPIAAIIALAFPANRIRRLAGFSLVTCFTFIFIISAAATKLPHYDAPAFPFLAIITAALFYSIYNILSALMKNRWPLFPANIAAFILVLLLLTKPYSDMIATVYFPHGDSWEEGFSNQCRFFQAVASHHEKLPANKLVYNTSKLKYGPLAVLNCYKEELGERGENFLVIDPRQVHETDTLLVLDHWNIRPQLEQQFRVSKIASINKYNIECISITNKK